MQRQTGPSLDELARTIRRNLILAIAVFTLVMAGGIAYTFTKKPLYRFDSIMKRERIHSIAQSCAGDQTDLLKQSIFLNSYGAGDWRAFLDARRAMIPGELASIDFSVKASGWTVQLTSYGAADQADDHKKLHALLLQVLQENQTGYDVLHKHITSNIDHCSAMIEARETDLKEMMRRYRGLDEDVRRNLRQAATQLEDLKAAAEDSGSQSTPLNSTALASLQSNITALSELLSTMKTQLKVTQRSLSEEIGHFKILKLNLESVLDRTAPAQVLQIGQRPAEPVPDNRIRYFLNFIVLGVLLGGGAAVIADRRRNRKTA